MTIVLLFALEQYLATGFNTVFQYSVFAVAKDPNSFLLIETSKIHAPSKS